MIYQSTAFQQHRRLVEGWNLFQSAVAGDQRSRGLHQRLVAFDSDQHVLLRLNAVDGKGDYGNTTYYLSTQGREYFDVSLSVKQAFTSGKTFTQVVAQVDIYPTSIGDDKWRAAWTLAHEVTGHALAIRNYEVALLQKDEKLGGAWTSLMKGDMSQEEQHRDIVRGDNQDYNAARAALVSYVKQNEPKFEDLMAGYFVDDIDVLKDVLHM